MVREQVTWSGDRDIGGRNRVKPDAKTVTVIMDNQWRPKPSKNVGQTHGHGLYMAVK